MQSNIIRVSLTTSECKLVFYMGQSMYKKVKLATDAEPSKTTRQSTGFDSLGEGFGS